MATRTITIIGRGWVGWHAAGPRFSLSGGDLYPHPWWTGKEITEGFTDKRTVGYLEETADGALVYDGSKADNETWARFVMAGPMVDPSLPPMGILPLSFTPMAISDTYREEVFPKLGPLDQVGVGVYELLLRKIPNVRIGRVRKGTVECPVSHGSSVGVCWVCGPEHQVKADVTWIEWEWRCPACHSNDLDNLGNGETRLCQSCSYSWVPYPGEDGDET